MDIEKAAGAGERHAETEQGSAEKARIGVFVREFSNDLAPAIRAKMEEGGVTNGEADPAQVAELLSGRTDADIAAMFAELNASSNAVYDKEDGRTPDDYLNSWVFEALKKYAQEERNLPLREHRG